MVFRPSARSFLQQYVNFFVLSGLMYYFHVENWFQPSIQIDLSMLKSFFPGVEVNDFYVEDFVFYALVIAIPLPLLRIYYNIKSYLFIISDVGVEMRYGFFSNSSFGIDYYNITTVQVDQSFISRLLGIGNIYFSSSGTSSAQDVLFIGVPNPHEVADFINARIKLMKSR